ncbi:MAG: DUF3696 domain-containing protein [Janthinobacterium lividum]
MLIEEIRVQGYKSLVDATLHVRPLTLLAGTNSSGKSSIMQPLLLIKQTMEAPYQPAGALVLDGAHVQAETAGELVSKVMETKDIIFKVAGLNTLNTKSAGCEIIYRLSEPNFLIVKQTTFGGNFQHLVLEPGLNSNEIKRRLRVAVPVIEESAAFQIGMRNGFLELLTVSLLPNNEVETQRTQFTFSLQNILGSTFHIPGLRISPSRNYLATTFQDQIRGTFDLYAAGTISQWQQRNDTEKLTQLNNYLQRLGLTNAVTAKVKNANEVELSVNRLPSTSKTKPRKADMVNIADVGIGVSQVLPILVALIAAQEGQLVYVEQPELHLHPRAQVAMGELLAEAANRGVRVIVETHSSLLLLTVQTLVAEGKIKPDDVGLHWFERDAKGATTVRYEQPDENGAYGEWPEDFGDVEMTAQRSYLDAVTQRQPKRAAKA